MLVRKRAVIVAIVLGVAALVGWSINGESSPFHQYLLENVAWPNLIGLANLPAFLLAALLSGNVHAPDDWAMYVGFLGQWLLIGYLLSLVLVRHSPKTAGRSANGAA